MGAQVPLTFSPVIVQMWRTWAREGSWLPPSHSHSELDSELSPALRSQRPLSHCPPQCPSPPSLGQSVRTQPVLTPDTWPGPAACGSQCPWCPPRTPPSSHQTRSRLWERQVTPWGQTPPGLVLDLLLTRGHVASPADEGGVSIRTRLLSQPPRCPNLRPSTEILSGSAPHQWPALVVSPRFLATSPPALHAGSWQTQKLHCPVPPALPPSLLWGPGQQNALHSQCPVPSLLRTPDS